MSRIGNFVLDVVARYNKDGIEWQFVYDVTNEKAYKHDVPIVTTFKNFESVGDLVEELVNAESIYYINKHYIQAIENEIFEGVYPKEKAYNVLYECYLNKQRGAKNEVYNFITIVYRFLSGNRYTVAS